MCEVKRTCEQTMPAKTHLCFHLAADCFLLYDFKDLFFFITEKGIRLVNEGQYSEAVNMFTEAIKCDPKDYRYYHFN